MVQRRPWRGRGSCGGGGRLPGAGTSSRGSGSLRSCGGRCRSRPGCAWAPFRHPLLSVTPRACALRFLKQNPPLKTMYRRFFCHRLILDIARLCSFPGHTTPQRRLLLSPGTNGPAHPGRTQLGFPNLGGGCSGPSPSPAAPGPSPGPGRRSRRGARVSGGAAQAASFPTKG